MSSGKKILIIEDEELLAANLMAYLERCDCDVRVANNAQGALQLLNEFVPEVVLMDYSLPGMNGFQTMDEIRRHHDQCGYILMTGHPSDEIRYSARQRGLREVLFKPFPLSELDAALTRGGALDPVQSVPVSCGEDTHCRQTDRRQSSAPLSLPFRLPTGGWLFTERRRADRRKS